MCVGKWFAAAVARTARAAWHALLPLAVAALLCACGMSRQDVIARMEKNFSAQRYRAAAVDLTTLVRSEPNDVNFRLKLAQSLLHIRDFGGAEAQFARARELGAPEATTLAGAAEALLGEGRFQVVLDRLQTAAPQLAQDATLQRVRGDALAALHRCPEARVAYATAMQLAPRDPGAHLGLATCLARAGDFPAVQAQLDAALQLDPRDFNVRTARGRWAVEQRRWPEARDEFASAVLIADGGDDRELQATARAALGETQLLLGDSAAAQQQLQRLEKFAPTRVPTLLLKARIELQLSHFKGAVAALDQLLSRYPNTAQAQLLMGVALAADGQFQRAEHFLAATLAAAPDNLTARKLLAEVQLREHHAQDALQTATAPTLATDPDLLSVAGRASLLTGDPQAAIKYLERDLTSQPNVRNRSLDLAAAYLAADRAADALALLTGSEVPDGLANRREALLLLALIAGGTPDRVRSEARAFATAHPADATALAISAGALAALHETAAARELLGQATAREPRAPQLWSQLGYLEIDAGDYPSAERALAQALQLDAHNPAALVGKAQLALIAGRRDTAIELLEQARAAAPGAVLPRAALARLYLAQQEPQRAAQPLAEARALAPADSGLKSLSAALALARGQSDEGLTILRQLVHESPNSPVRQADLARGLAMAGRLAEARSANDAALRLEPGYWPARVTAVELALAQHDAAGADALLPALRGSAAPRPAILTLEGDVAASRDRLSDALRAYTSAAALAPSAQLAIKMFAARRALKTAEPDAPLREWLRQQPRDARTRAVLALYLQRAGDRAGAIREYKAALAYDPQQVVALNNLALLVLANGESTAALDLAHRAYTASAGRSPSVTDTYGWALVQSGRTEDAVPLLRSAYQQAPDNNEIRYHLGVALLKSGATREARELLQGVVDAQPGPEADEARALLSRLGAKTDG